MSHHKILLPGATVPEVLSFEGYFPWKHSKLASWVDKPVGTVALQGLPHPPGSVPCVRLTEVAKRAVRNRLKGAPALVSIEETSRGYAIKVSDHLSWWEEWLAIVPSIEEWLQ